MLNFYYKITTKSCAIVCGTALFFGFVLIFIVPDNADAATVTPRISISGNPGQTVLDSIKLVNEQRESKTYYITFANFESQDETGNPHFSDKREDLSAWIESVASVSVGPGDSVEIPFEVNIPANADPGGHFAAIFFQVEPPSDQEVAISSKLGSLIYLTVAGDFQQGATILEFSSLSKRNFFTSLPISFYYRFQNTGEQHLKPVGDVLISNSLGRLSKILPANTVDGTVLPKSIRRFETVWASGGDPLQEVVNPNLPIVPTGFWNNVQYEWQNFAFGKYTATLKVVFGTGGLQSTNADFVFYVIPWHLLLVVFVTLLLLVIIGRFSLKKYNKYIISKAYSERKTLNS